MGDRKKPDTDERATQPRTRTQFLTPPFGVVRTPTPVDGVPLVVMREDSIPVLTDNPASERPRTGDLPAVMLPSSWVARVETEQLLVHKRVQEACNRADEAGTAAADAVAAAERIEVAIADTDLVDYAEFKARTESRLEAIDKKAGTGQKILGVACALVIGSAAGIYAQVRSGLAAARIEAASVAAERAASMVEHARFRADIDTLRAEFAARFTLFVPDNPAGDTRP